jgi:hypothetical protein
MLLGSGLMAYRKMLMSLCISFVLMSILMLPVIEAYKNGTGLANSNSDSVMDQMTIANLGYSSLQCS